MKENIFKRRSFKMASAASILGGLLVYLILSALLGQKGVVVATQKIEAGKIVTKEMVALKPVSTSSVIKGAYQNLDEVVSKVAAVSRYPGDQISVEMLGGSKTTISKSKLKPGEVLMSLDVSDQGIGNLLKAGDVISIVDASSYQIGQTVDRSLPPNLTAPGVIRHLTVLEVSRSEEKANELSSSASKSGVTIFFAISLDEVQRLAQIKEMGKYEVVIEGKGG